MPAWYNEIDPFAAQWLRNLIAAGHIAPGDVDERSIVDVRPDDLAGYTQCHFFAGIGGWSLALRLAGWPDDRPVWTGSCPCQPFSAAGKGAAFDDERHLWPAWFSLVSECRPATVFGEQVEAAIGWGWLDAVFADLEGQGYACGAAVLPACGVGAPHIRQRLWFVADSVRGGAGDASGQGVRAQGQADGEDGRISRERSGPRIDRAACELANANTRGRERSGLHLSERRQDEAILDPAGPSQAGVAQGDAWHCAWLPCTDRKARPVEPGTFPLAHGIPGRVGRLRAYGNAIVPQVASEFIAAAAESM